MDRSTARLLDTLDKLVVLLERYGEVHWNERLRGVCRLLRERDPDWRQELWSVYEKDEAGKLPAIQRID